MSVAFVRVDSRFVTRSRLVVASPPETPAYQGRGCAMASVERQANTKAASGRIGDMSSPGFGPAILARSKSVGDVPMLRLAIAAGCLALALGARAEPWTGP